MKKNSDKLILDLCGGTGAWSKPYREAGYNVVIIDSALDEGVDVRLLTANACQGVYGILCAPPCTDLCNGGARYWKEKGGVALIEALSVVDACLRIVLISKPHFWVLENPAGRLIHYLGEPLMRFHPYMFGDGYSKYTCLWGVFNPPGKWFPVPSIKGSPGQHSQDVYNRKVKGIKFGHKIRSRVRSITPPGFAEAFFKANP